MNAYNVIIFMILTVALNALKDFITMIIMNFVMNVEMVAVLAQTTKIVEGA